MIYEVSELTCDNCEFAVSTKSSSWPVHLLGSSFALERMLRNTSRCIALFLFLHLDQC